MGPTGRGKGTKIMAIGDRAGLPVAICTESASPNEVTLVERTLESRFVEDLPERLIGDKAYDSDKLDERVLEKYGIEMISPNREGNRRSQDGRPLRRYKRCWKIERLIAWLTQLRRIPVRYEYWIENYLGFLHLACILILLRCS